MESVSVKSCYIMQCCRIFPNQGVWPARTGTDKGYDNTDPQNTNLRQGSRFGNLGRISIYL